MTLKYTPWGGLSDSYRVPEETYSRDRYEIMDFDDLLE